MNQRARDAGFFVVETPEHSLSRQRKDILLVRETTQPHRRDDICCGDDAKTSTAECILLVGTMSLTCLAVVREVVVDSSRLCMSSMSVVWKAMVVNWQF
jgi:hypothetical protein